MEVIVVAAKQIGLRCLRLPERNVVVLRPVGGVREEVEGEILKVSVNKEWRYKSTTYISGDVLGSYIDGAVLSDTPLKLNEHYEWDPEAGFLQAWFDGAEDSDEASASLKLPEWAKSVLRVGTRKAYEMERVIPGEDPADFDSDPIVEAAELTRAGDMITATEILQRCLEQDLRCVDAYVHLGNIRMADLQYEWHVKRALKSYRAGVSVGEQALPPGFNGLLPWALLDNRPFLRALHAVSLCQWRLGDTAPARSTFMRLLMLDPEDSLGVRFLLHAMEAGLDYLGFAARDPL